MVPYGSLHADDRKACIKTKAAAKIKSLLERPATSTEESPQQTRDVAETVAPWEQNEVWVAFSKRQIFNNLAQLPSLTEMQWSWAQELPASTGGWWWGSSTRVVEAAPSTFPKSGKLGQEVPLYSCHWCPFGEGIQLWWHHVIWWGPSVMVKSLMGPATDLLWRQTVGRLVFLANNL